MNVGAAGTSGPSITITDCYEGLEAATLNIRSGDIAITAEDDCLNAANSDLTNYDFSMTISGGTVNAYSAGGALAPRGTATRAQTAMILMRFCQKAA